MKDMNAVDVKGLGSKYYSGEPLVALGDKKAENAGVEWKENKEKLNAVMYLACCVEGLELGEEQKANVDKYLGQGVFENFSKADTDLQNEQLKQFAIQGWTGQEGISWLDEAELAEAMGLKSSHASEFAGKFREQARIVIEENNRVLAEKQIGLDFIKEKIRNGQFVDSGKAVYEKLSPEANQVISRLATSADKAAKIIYHWEHDEDADDSYSGGGKTGFRIKGANAWHGFVKDLADLKREDAMAYELALEAMNQMVVDSHKNHGVLRAFMPDFMVDMPLEIGDKLGIKEYQEGLMEITSRIPAQVVTGFADAGQAALSKIHDVFVEKEIPEGFEEQLKAGKLGDKYSFEDWWFDRYHIGVMGGMKPMTYEEKKRAIIFSKDMDSPEKRDAKWKEYVQEMYDRQLKSVLADLQAVKDARWQSTAEEGGVRAFVQDSLDVIGAAIPFILTRGVASGINEADKAQNKYVSEGAGNVEAAQAGAGEGVAHVLTNIWGLGTFGGGQYAGGYVRKWWDLAFNKLQNKVGTKNLLGKVIKQDEWVRRIGFVGLESAVLHGQTLAEPYTRAVGGRLFTDGQLGKRWEEAHKEFDEVATWRNYFTALPMSVLFGMMPGNGRSKHRSIGIAEATVREMQLDVAESRECMEGLGMEEADIKAVLSEGDSTKRVELLHEGIKKVESKDEIDKGGDSVLFIPEKSLPMQLAELGEIPTFEMIDDNTVRIYEKGEGEESSYRDMPMQEANAYLNYLSMKWLIKQRERVQDLLNESNEATVEYFAKKLGIEFKESKEKFSIEHLKKLANEAFARAYDLERELSKAEARFDRQNNPEPFGEREAKMRQDLEDALAMQSVPTSFRQRVELAIQRGELSEENAGELHPAAMNYLLPCGKKVIRYYNGDCTPLELLEEVIELWVKGEVVNGRPKEFFLEGLKESQAYLLGHGGLKDGELLIAENLLFDGKADSELTDLERKMRDKALIEGMSMLAKSVYVGDLANQKNLPSVVRRFMLYLRAVVEKVMDMLNLAGTFKAGVDAGAINRDFADFVYEACGSDFASARAEATTYGMQKELRDMVEGVNNALAGGDELGLKSHGPGMSLETAKENGLIKNGVGVFGNGILVEPGADVDFALKALHASPHLFSKFDTAFMGSGEGHQSLAWGFYFATRNEVNKWYFHIFNQVKQEVVTIDGKPLKEIVAQAPVDSPLGIAYNSCDKDINLLASIIYREIYNPAWKKPLVARFERIIDDCKRSLADESTPVSHRKEIENNLFDAQQKLDILASYADIINTHDVEAIQQGSINYRVTLKAEDAELLMWDKGFWLHELNENVRQGVEELTGELDAGYSSGEAFYHMLVKALGSPKAASEWLLERGVKGIKYADDGSRVGETEKTYNYVMFSGDDVVIEKIDRSGVWNVDFDKWENPSDVFGGVTNALAGGDELGLKSHGPGMSVDEAKGKGIIKNGVGVFGNGILVEPGADVDFAFKALHISPNLFPEFDLEHLSEGAGSQDFGYGLYFAGNQKVNNRYYSFLKREAGHEFLLIKGGKKITSKGFYKELPEGMKFEHLEPEVVLTYLYCLSDGFVQPEDVPYLLKYGVYRYSELLDLIEYDVSELIADRRKIYTPLPYIDNDIANILKLHKLGYTVEYVDKKPTNYEVVLDVMPHHLISWFDDILVYDNRVNLISDVLSLLNISFEELLAGDVLTGERLYNLLSDKLGSNKEASLWLLNHGIKGIAQKPTFGEYHPWTQAEHDLYDNMPLSQFNFIIFDPSLITIIKISREAEWIAKDKYKFMWENPSDVFGGVTNALVEGSIRGELEAGLVNASEYVADYWGKVDARLGKELESIEKLLSRGVIDDRAKAVMMEARAALRVAVDSLPNSSYKDAMMKKLAIVDEHLQSVALSRLGSTEYKEGWLLNRVGQFFKEIAEGVRMCASVELTKELKALLTYHNGSVDEKTGMWRKSKIGAEGVRFLRQVIIPAFEATVEDADRKVEWLESQVARLKPDELGLNFQHNDVEYTKTMREYLWWQKYGGLFEGESSLEVLVAAQKELNAFLQENGEKWNKAQADKAKKIMRQQNSLVAELTVNVTEDSVHKSQEDFHLSHMDKNGKLREGVWNSMLQNPVRQIELWSSREGKGKKFFSWFLKQFVKASDAVSYEMVAEQKRMNERLKSVFRAKNQSELDKALVRWGCEEVEIKEKLTPLIEEKIKLNVDEAEAIVKGEQESSFNEGEKELIRRKLFLYEQTHGTSGMIEFVVYRDGQGEELNVPKLTRDQMLFVLMSMNQPGAYNTWDGSLSPMRKKGWNDAIKAELESLVGAEGQYLMNVLFEGYAMQGDKIRPLYEARYGMPFSERRTYSPLRWVVADTKSDVDLASVMGDTGLVQVTRADSFIMARRMDHSRFLDTSVGALQLYWKSFAQTNNWVHTQGVLETVRAILSDQNVANKLMVNMGGMDYRGFQVLLNQLEHGGRDISAQFDMSEIHKNSLINIRAIGHLAGALTTITKNTTTILNALHGCDLSIAEWVVALGRVLNGTSKIGVRELFDSNVFQARRETYTYGHLLGIKKTFGGRLGRAEQLTDWYMRMMNNVDAGGNAVSFAAAFDHYFREGERNKMTSGEAMDYAWEKIEVGLATAQPINWVTSPALMRNSRGAGNFNLYLMGENLQKLGTFTNLWARGEFKLAMRSWLLSGLGMQVIGYLVNMCMRPGHEEEDEKNVLKYIPGILLGPLNGFPALGYGLGYGFDKLYEAVTGEKGGFKYTTGVVGNELVLRIKEFSRAWNTLSEWDDAKDIRDKASALASAANVVATACGFRTPRGSQVINVAQAVSGVAHSVRDMMGISMSPFTAEACDILFDTRAKEKAEREERIKARAKRFRELRER